MELKFPKTVCKYLNPIVNQVVNQELTQELRLSDGMPDIGRVLAGWGQIILRSKEWRSDSASFSGGLMVWVLYTPEDGTAPRVMESWIPFQMKWDLPDGHKEGNIRVQCLLRFVDARSVAARKIMLRAGVAVQAEAARPEEAELGVAGEVPEDVQLLKAVYPVRLPREAGEKTFVMDEELTLPGSCPRPEKLIYYNMQPRITEKKVMANRIAFRGNGNLHVLYLSEDGQLHSWDFELPFSQLAELEGTYSADAQADICMGVTSLELELDDESHLRLKTGLLEQHMVDDREMLELVEDAYSPGRAVELDRQMLELPAVLERKTEPVHAEQSIRQDANLIADAEYLPDFPRQRRSGDGIQMELPGQFQTLYYGEDGTLQSSVARWEGDFQLPADTQSSVNSAMLPVERASAIASQDTIELDAEAALQLTTMGRQGIPMVMGLRLGEQKQPDPNRPSVILRRAGDARLWDIAKSTGSTVSAIQKANGLETEPAENQILLIPVP